MMEYFSAVSIDNSVVEVVQESNVWSAKVELWNFFDWPLMCWNERVD
jgi:hypothetical protein